MTRPSYQSRTRRDNPDLDALLAELGDRVEADVRAGRRPPLTLYAAQALAPYRPRVFHELLVVEMQARQRAGELVAVEVFRERYPGQESAVEAAHRSAFGPAGGSSTGRRAIREGDVVGEYRLVRMVGHGGMGLVFLAEDVGSGESVAVKFLPPELLGASPELASQARLMFAREADAALQIDHPNVVKVRGRGEEDGFAYLVMEYVNGPSLREQLRRTGPLPPRDAAEVIEAVARGLEAAHELGILHRDIKPGNVLLQLRGPEESGGSDDPTVPVRGLAPDATTGTGPGERSSPLEVIIPKLADFGLAKQLDPTRSEATLTVGGMGTLTYSAPEQAGGKTHTGRRADVYSLGATLYECLTGRPPFHAADAMETLRQVLDEDPAPPRRLNPQVPPGVDLVCLKCLRKDPHKRYATAGELADDLRRFIDGRRVRARRESMWERGVKWTRRHPARAAGLAVGFIALVALGGVWRGLERQREMDQITRRVDDLVQAEPSRVSGLIDELVRGGSRAEAVVRERWDQSDPRPRERARLALALVKFDPKSDDSPPARLLVERLPVADAGELRLIREALAPRADQLRPTVVAGLDGPDPDQRLRFAAVLAGHEPDAPELVPHWNGLAERLVRENPVDLAAWVDMLRPATRHLRPPLEKLFKERHRADEARAAAAVLVALLERPTDLLDLIDLDADAVQYRYIADKLLTRPDETRVELAQRLTGRWEGSTEAEKDIRARAQAHYAALALRLDPDGPAWTHLLQPPSEDCRLQSYLVHWLPSRGVPADAVLRRCDLESGLAALLLTLGSYDEQQLPLARRAELEPRLWAYFREHPDPGVHSAAEWLLRKWGRGEKVDRVTAEFAGKPAPTGRRWFVTPGGVTMIVFAEPLAHELRFFEFFTGIDEKPVNATVDLVPFAISARKLPASVVEKWWKKREPRPKRLLSGVSHNVAAEYCNALTIAEGFGADQCCYQLRDDTWRLKENFRELRGYRIPTDAEWDFATRLQTRTTRYYGNDPGLLPEYGINDLAGSASSVQLTKPGAAGLFECLGSPWDLCNRCVANRQLRNAESMRGLGNFQTREAPRNDYASIQGPSQESLSHAFRLVRRWPVD